ncbi:hypothetical protein RUM44_002890 [Polyplax serrata]|uniref:Uncharacterized protein n=1 Tax=Polyplax serrata TaxID=468196 RepID=A0ABR1AX02_POLSC
MATHPATHRYRADFQAGNQIDRIDDSADLVNSSWQELEGISKNLLNHGKKNLELLKLIKFQSELDKLEDQELLQGRKPRESVRKKDSLVKSKAK